MLNIRLLINEQKIYLSHFGC